MNKNTNTKNKYFKIWKDIDQKIKNDQAKSRVARYIKNRFKISNARKNWVKLGKLLSLKNRNNDVFTLINKIKQYSLLNKFKDPFISLARKEILY